MLRADIGGLKWLWTLPGDGHVAAHGDVRRQPDFCRIELVVDGFVRYEEESKDDLAPSRLSSILRAIERHGCGLEAFGRIKEELRAERKLLELIDPSLCEDPFGQIGYINNFRFIVSSALDNPEADKTVKTVYAINQDYLSLRPKTVRSAAKLRLR